jgi:NTE family protein
MRLIPLRIFPLLLLAPHAVAQQVDSIAVPHTGYTSRVVTVQMPSETKTLAPFSDRVFIAPRRPKIGLVLSGGGARGLAQIGVIKALVEAGIEPDFIAGTSIGSIIGGLYASGYSVARLESAIKAIQWDELLRLSNSSDREYIMLDQKPAADRSILTLRFDGIRPVLPLSVSNGQRLTNLLNELALQGLYHGRRFDELRIPFRAVATDLYTGKRVVLADGNLADAMRASSTVPVVYAPVTRDSMALVDGGLMANIPVDLARVESCDIVIAVNTASPLRDRAHITNPVETLDQVFNITMERSNAEQLARADLVVLPRIDAYNATDFFAHDSLILRGYEAGKAAARTIASLVADRFRAFYARAILDGAGLHDRAASPESASRNGGGLSQRVLDRVVAAATDGSTGAVRITLNPYAVGEISVQATPLPRVASIAVTGAKLIPRARMDSVIDRWSNMPMGYRGIRGLCEDIIGLYRDIGLSLASVDSVAIDSAGRGVSVNIDEGMVDSIQVVGNLRTNPVVILRELPFRVGRVFTIDDLRAAMQNLTGLNLFHQVSIDVAQRRAGTTVIVRVEERPSQALQVNMLIDNERNAQFGLTVRDANLFGTGSDLSFEVFGGFQNRKYLMQYFTNRLFYTRLSFLTRAYYDLRDYNYYVDVPGPSPSRFERDLALAVRRVAYGATVSAGIHARQFGKLTASLRIEQQSLQTFDFAIPDTPPITEDHRIVAIGFGTAFDTRDRTPYTSSGALLNAEYSSSQNALGSQVPFTRIHFNYEEYIPVRESRFVLHARFQFGFGDLSMPRTEEFRLGGLHTFFGMRENEFTGRQLLVGSAALQYKLPVSILFDSYATVRYDLGRTWEIPEQIKFDALRHGIGVAIGLDTPIGPADFGIGRSFTIDATTGARVIRWGDPNVYFSVGFEL